MRDIKLRNINDIIAEIQDGFAERVKGTVESMAKDRDDTIARIERNRRIIALLDAAGFEMVFYTWSKGDSVTLDLGFFPSTAAGSRALANKLRTFRTILECKLGLPSRSLGDEKKLHVRFTLRPDDYPGVSITYHRRLPPGAKCKIVTQRSTYRNLVCDLAS